MSHTGNALGNFGVEGLRQSRILTPFVAAQNLKNVLHCWYNADFLNVDANGLVSGALDLTRRGNNGTQTTEANRLTYFPSDAMFGGLPSFGSNTNTGFKHILAGVQTPLVRAICSAYYKSGIESTFTEIVGIIGNISGAGSYVRSSGTGGSAFTSAIFASGTYSKNGIGNVPFSSTVLPLPASTLVFTSGSTVTQRTWGFCNGGTGTTDQSWIGGFRNLIIVPGFISAAQVALIEGVMAWDGKHQYLLAANHPYRFIPPLVRD